jgi:hypothetical protein
MKKPRKRSKNKFANNRVKTGGQKTFYVNYELADAFDAAAEEFNIKLSTWLNCIIHEELVRVGRLPASIPEGTYNGEPIELPPTAFAFWKRAQESRATPRAFPQGVQPG